MTEVVVALRASSEVLRNLHADNADNLVERLGERLLRFGVDVQMEPLKSAIEEFEARCKRRLVGSEFLLNRTKFINKI